MAKPRGKPFEKGKVANPKGRGKGTLNAMTGTVKEIISSIIDNEFQSGRAAEALKSLYEKNEIQYLQALDKLSECVVPKLSRTEITGENGEAIKIISVSVGVQSEKI